MNYRQTLEYLFNRLPMYQRVGTAAYKADLVNIQRITEILGKPHTRLKFIHVAGTNGKGSCSHMLAAILQKSGYRTGLYTSPHLSDFRERIRINGKMIPQKNVVEFVSEYKDKFEAVEPSFFEWSFGLALHHFTKEETDVAVVETGLGGRLDSTNIITPQVSLITNVSLDHTNLLGDTIPKIAREKAGIIKHKVPVVISQHQSQTAGIFGAVAREMRSRIEFADKNYKVNGHHTTDELLSAEIMDRRNGETRTYELDLTGTYQLKNLIGVLNTLEFVEEAGFVIQHENVISALKQVGTLTGLQGRWQKLGKKPLIIADAAHNEEGINQVLESIRSLKFKTLHVVFGAVSDKDLNGILEKLPAKARYYFVKADIPRALDADELTKVASEHGLKGVAFKSVKAGVKAAKKTATAEDLVFIGGSTFVVAEAMEILRS